MTKIGTFRISLPLPNCAQWIGSIRQSHRIVHPEQAPAGCRSRRGSLKPGAFCAVPVGEDDAMAETSGGPTGQAATTLDATGLLCPLPVLKARRALKAVPAGGILEVLATDPGATKDFEHFCQTTGCQLVEASEQPGGILRFLLKKPD